MIETKRALGVGLYTPAEAAHFVRARPEALARWVYGNLRGDAVLRPRFDDPDKTITFVDMIQTLAIRAVRTQQRRIPLQKVREAVLGAINDYDVAYPLAMRHRLFAFQNSVVIKLDETNIVGLSGPDRNQRLLVPIVEPFLDEISFSDSDGLAETWTPMKFNDYVVQLDARYRFGQPVIQPGMILVDSLAAAAVSEGSIEAAAEEFETSVDAVKLALKYQDSLTGLAA